MTADHVDVLTTAPLGCAFLLAVEQGDLDVATAVRPDVALEIAAGVAEALTPWTGYHAEAVAEVLAAGPRLRDLAARCVAHPDATWWFAALDRRHQVWLGDGPDDELAVTAPTSEPSRWEGYAHRPEDATVTATAYGDHSGLHAVLTMQTGDWDPTFPLPQVRVTAGEQARIFEVDGPQAWHDLARRYPGPGDDEHSGDLAPRWAAVATDYEAVHLCFGGLLTATFVPVTSDAGTSRLWAWDTESTLWLRDVFSTRQTMPPLPRRPRERDDLPRLWLEILEQDRPPSYMRAAFTTLTPQRWWHWRGR